jgi:hypothetical protein
MLSPPKINNFHPPNHRFHKNSNSSLPLFKKLKTNQAINLNKHSNKVKKEQKKTAKRQRRSRKIKITKKSQMLHYEK